MSVLLQLYVSRLRILQLVLLCHLFFRDWDEPRGRPPRPHVSLWAKEHHAALLVGVYVVSEPDPKLGAVRIDCLPDWLQIENCSQADFETPDVSLRIQVSFGPKALSCAPGWSSCCLKVTSNAGAGRHQVLTGTAAEKEQFGREEGCHQADRQRLLDMDDTLHFRPA